MKETKLGEKTAFRMGENNRKWNNWQGINLKNIQAAPAAQFQQNKFHIPYRPPFCHSFFFKSHSLNDEDNWLNLLLSAFTWWERAQHPEPFPSLKPGERGRGLSSIVNLNFLYRDLLPSRQLWEQGKRKRCFPEVRKEGVRLLDFFLELERKK